MSVYFSLSFAHFMPQEMLPCRFVPFLVGTPN